MLSLAGKKESVFVCVCSGVGQTGLFLGEKVQVLLRNDRYNEQARAKLDRWMDDRMQEWMAGQVDGWMCE